VAGRPVAGAAAGRKKARHDPDVDAGLPMQ